MRMWWNWQTRMIQVHMLQGMQVQVLSSAPKWHKPAWIVHLCGFIVEQIFYFTYYYSWVIGLYEPVAHVRPVWRFLLPCGLMILLAMRDSCFETNLGPFRLARTTAGYKYDSGARLVALRLCQITIDGNSTGSKLLMMWS